MGKRWVLLGVGLWLFLSIGLGWLGSPGISYARLQKKPQVTESVRELTEEEKVAGENADIPQKLGRFQGFSNGSDIVVLDTSTGNCWISQPYKTAGKWVNLGSPVKAK